MAAPPPPNDEIDDQFLGVLVPFTAQDTQFVIDALAQNPAVPLTDNQISVKNFIQQRRVLCPYPENYIFVQFMFYHQLCPPGFSVIHVYGARAQKKPFCRWFVVYQVQNPALIANRKLAISKLHDCPTNAKIIPNSLRFLPSHNGAYYEVEYGMAESKCACKDFYSSTPSDILDVETASLILSAQKLSAKSSIVYWTIPPQRVLQESHTNSTCLLSVKKTHLVMKLKNDVIGVLLYMNNSTKIRKEDVVCRMEEESLVVYSSKNPKLRFSIPRYHLRDVTENILDVKIHKNVLMVSCQVSMLK